LLAGSAVSLSAQRPETIRITVMTFRTPGIEDKALGAKAADKLRDHIQDKFSERKVYVVPTKDVANNLEASGFPINDTLPPVEERTLANLLRADDYVTGRVTRDGRVYHVDARLVLSRDARYAQPLPPQQNDDLDDALDDMSKALREAMKQLPAERSCVGKARSGDVEGAIAVAREAIQDYPAATLVRLCIANIQYDLYRNATTAADSLSRADSTLAVANVILQYDSLSVPALRFATELYKLRGDSARSRQAALTLVKADPSDSKLVEQVINELASTGHAADAIPLVKDMLERNPGDSATLHTAFAVYVAAQDWPNVVATGPALVRTDTAAADTTYYLRMAYAHEQMKEPQKAAEVMAQAVAKFPNNRGLLLGQFKYLNDVGQTQQAGEVLKKLATLDPGQGLLQLAGFYARQNQPDSVYATLQTLSQQTLSDTALRSVAAKFAMAQASLASKAAAVSKSDSDFVRAIHFGQLSDKLEPSDLAKFMTGAAVLQLSQKQLQANVEGKSCSVAQSVRDNLAIGQSALEGVSPSSSYGGQAKTYVGYLKQFLPPVKAQIEKFCSQ
jgi:tetratricopeptide (TPR) repeat protein